MVVVCRSTTEGRRDGDYYHRGGRVLLVPVRERLMCAVLSGPLGLLLVVRWWLDVCCEDRLLLWGVAERVMCAALVDVHSYYGIVRECAKRTMRTVHRWPVISREYSGHNVGL